MKKGMVIVAVAFAMLVVAFVPLVYADNYTYHIPDGMVTVKFSVINDKQNGLYSHLNPGKKAYIGIAVNNHFKTSHLGYRNLCLIGFFYKNDWDSKWIEDKETENNEVVIMSSSSGNSTEGVTMVTIDIPKNATIGNHTLSIKMKFSLLGNGWQELTPYGESDYVYANYTYTVNPSSDAGSNGGTTSTGIGGIPLWEAGAIAAVVVIAVVAGAIFLMRRR